MVAMEQKPESTPLRPRKHPVPSWLERVLLVSGAVLLTVFAIGRFDGWMSSRAALQQFDQGHIAEKPVPPGNGHPLPGKDEVDFGLWSKQRIEKFMESLSLAPEPALAVLELERLRIRVPVFAGTGELALNRGVGWIPGTARPGEMGNIGIAGHRDGFFRGLMHVQAGDRIELQLPDQTMVYRVSRTEVVNPGDVQVLQPQGQPSLTLVTCFPFYFVGNAPQRFIVFATLEGAQPADDQEGGQ